MRRVRYNFMAMVMTIFLTMSLCSCQKSETKEETNTTNSTNESEEQVKMVVTDISEDSDSEDDTEEIDESTTQKSSYNKIAIGDAINLEFVEINMSKISIENELYPRDTSGVYMYMPAMEGKKYIQAVGALKNTFTSMYEVNNVIVQFVFDDKYTYSGYLKADAGLFEAYDYQVDPFETVDIHIIGEIPDELINTFAECKIQFGFSNNFEDVRDLESCEYQYELTYSK